MKYSRRPYLLLEVLLCTLLIALCVGPLIYSTFNTSKAHYQLLEQTQLERFADMSYSEIKEMLYEGKISWKQMSEGERIDLTPVKIPVRKDAKALYTRTCQLKILKEEKDDSSFSLLETLIIFRKPDSQSSKEYSYWTLIEHPLARSEN